MAIFAFVLLIAALILFLVSTRQWALWIRGVVWGSGMVMLIAASVMVASDNDHGGVFRAFGDLAAHWNNPGASVLVQSFSYNGPHIARFVLPLLDLFLIIGGLLGVLALAAFTPGEALEKIARPIAIGMVGAILGGILAMAIVGTGFGDVAQQEVYSTYTDDDNVFDGDTLWMGQVRVRLFGIDAPERDQICRQGPNIIRCGAEASRHLEGLISGALVTCTIEGKNSRSEDTFGFPLVNCSAARGDQKFDLAQRMIEDGYAIEYKGQIGDFAREARIALDAQRGILHACSLRPDVWDTDARAQVAFRDRGIIPQAALTMGRCPPPTRRPQGSGGPAPVQP